jgi:hypothetical protein
MIWTQDWVWGAVSSALLISFHVAALFCMSVVIFYDSVVELRERSLFFSIVAFSLLGTGAVLLHALEAAGWAALYWSLGAADEYSDALLHSLGAYSTMGDSTITFEKKWRLLLQIEALTAAVTLGLTTAFLFSALSRLQRVIDGGRAKADISRHRE